MSEIIFHHFDSSPFAEKIRLVFGLKSIAWRSVEIPMVMPKPDLTALTGGYRKTPVMQVGADIYCDTQRIARELERRFPSPSLFPDHSEGLCLALSHWSDTAFFQAGAGLSMATNDAIPEAVLKDRRAFFNFLDFEDLDAEVPHLFASFNVQSQLVENMLADGRSFILGEQPSWADMLAYFPVWMCRGNITGANDLLQPFARLCNWEQRVSALGHGERSSMSSMEALEVARSAMPEVIPTPESVGSGPAVQAEIPIGARVDVLPRDYGSARVRGELLLNTHTDIAIRRNDERMGELTLHFPRNGYQIDQVL